MAYTMGYYNPSIKPSHRSHRSLNNHLFYHFLFFINESTECPLNQQPLLLQPPAAPIQLEFTTQDQQPR